LKREQSRGGAGVAAWAVHLLTALGAVLALLALDAVEKGREFAALAWLGVALVVDGVDGTLARRAKVRERVPNIDGEALDLVVDYLTYVFVPALLIWRGGHLPDALALPLTAAILMSSLYVFVRRDMKTEDGYFRGFPALWNVVALYFVVAMPSQVVAAAAVVILVVTTFAPVHVVHPFRVRDYGAALPMVAIAWAAFTAPLLIPDLGTFAQRFLLAMSLATAAALAVMGLLRTVREARRQ
jgi:phosphatidylcholine synthase